MKKSILLILLFFATSICYAQKHEMDSMLHVLSTEKEDTNRVNTLNNLSFSLYLSKPDTAILLAQQADALATKLGWIKGEAYANCYEGLGYKKKSNYSKATDCSLKSLKMAEETGNKNIQVKDLSNLAAIFFNQGNYPKSLDYAINALKLNEELGDKLGQATNVGNIANVYNYQGDYPRALENYLKALKLAEELGNVKMQVKLLGNMGVLYHYQGDNNKALEYYQKALKIEQDAGDKTFQPNNFCNMATIYDDMHEYSKAIDYYQKALKMSAEIGDREVEVTSLGNIGNAYANMHEYAKALDYYEKGLKRGEEMGDTSIISVNYGNIGDLYVRTEKYKDAEEYLKKAIAIDSSIGDENSLMLVEEGLSDMYDSTGRGKLALVWFKKAMAIKDTLFNADKNKALTRKELTYTYEKKEAAAKAEQDQKDAIAAEDKHKQQIITWTVLSGLLLALVFAGFIFRSLRVTRKQKRVIEIKNIETERQKKLIEEQKALVEEKNKDILDSINYAKRLQEAILPPVNIIKKYLPESFLLYKPKDIVAGDFYWLEKAGDTILIAAADCTGHGVPGALVSVVCSNALNRTVKEFKITEPGKILDKVRELVLETFEKSESNVQDGMDISLAAISYQPMAISWSGAYNSLWYVHNNQVIEVAADKQPIGKTDNPKTFTTHNLNIQKGDTLYLFTDGYADQFGGPKGKKFKYKQLQEKLLAISHQSMAEQKQILETTLDEWKGDLEQVDDILIIGVKV